MSTRFLPGGQSLQVSRPATSLYPPELQNLQEVSKNCLVNSFDLPILQLLEASSQRFKKVTSTTQHTADVDADATSVAAAAATTSAPMPTTYTKIQSTALASVKTGIAAVVQVSFVTKNVLKDGSPMQKVHNVHNVRWGDILPTTVKKQKPLV